MVLKDPQRSFHVKNPMKGFQKPSSGDGLQSHTIPFLVHDGYLYMIYEGTIIKAADGLTYADLGGESVVLDLNTGSYFGLNEVGARVFEIIKQPTPVRTILEVLLEEYQVDSGQLEKDVFEFLRRMQEANLVYILNGTAS